MERYVKWMQWSKNGLINHGMMTLPEIRKMLLQFESEAKKLLHETGADHVVYGITRYDDKGEIEDVRFYLEPMNDFRFQVDVAVMQNVRVYALHKMK